MIVIDGPVGTELEARGVATPAPLWSAWAIDHAPDVLAAIHRDYAAAGATVHTAATFRTKRRDAGEDWERLARRAVGIAREAVPRSHRVAGSVAPLADCWRPDLAPTDRALLAREHGELARALADAGVDLLLCETFAAPHEALAAVEACVATGVETWIAMTAGPHATLLSPRDLARAAKACVDAGARGALVNCVSASHTSSYVSALAEERLGVPIGAYANAGPPEDATPEAYARFATQWRDAGATIVGACCYARPAHVAAVAAIAR